MAPTTASSKGRARLSIGSISAGGLALAASRVKIVTSGVVRVVLVKALRSGRYALEAGADSGNIKEGSSPMSFLSGLPAVVASKAAVGITVATLAVGGAGAVTATAVTGSANPSVWGQTVTAAVTDCKGKLTAGMHAIGSCVSAVAKQKGEQERAQHSPGSPAISHPTGAPTSHPTGPPTSHPTGRP